MTSSREVVRPRLPRAIVASGAALAAVMAVGVLKDMVLASRFGTTATADALSVALTVPVQVAGMLTGAFGAVLVPQYVAAREADPGMARRMVAGVVLSVGLVMGVCSVGFVMFPAAVLKVFTPGFDEKRMGMAASLLRLAGFALLGSGLAQLFVNLHQARYRFGWPTAAGAVVPGMVLIATILYSDRLGATAPVIALVSGVFLLCALLLPGQALDFRLFDGGRLQEVARIWRLAVPMLFTFLLIYLNRFILKAVASFLPAGSLSSYGYAERIVILPYTLMVGSVSTTLFPFLSSAVTTRNPQRFEEITLNGIAFSAMVLLPASVLFWISRYELVELLFGRGMFNAESVSLVALALGPLAFCLPLWLQADILERGLQSHGRYWILFLVQLFDALLVMVVGLYSAARLGVAGLGLTFTLMQGLNAILFLLVLVRVRVLTLRRQFISTMLKVTLASVATGGLVLCAKAAVRWESPAETVLVTTLLLAFLYLLMLTLLRVREWQSVRRWAIGVLRGSAPGPGDR